MTVLVDWQIQDAINHGEIIISAFDPSLINPNSIDIRLGDQILDVVATRDDNIIDPTDKDSFMTIIHCNEQDENLNFIENQWLIPHNDFVLASMYETIELAPTICAKILGKSSLARLGLSNSDAAGWVDSKWNGNLTMELFNHSKRNFFRLKKGMKIGQIVFYRVDRPEKGYDMTGRYQNQLPGMGSLGV